MCGSIPLNFTKLTNADVTLYIVHRGVCILYQQINNKHLKSLYHIHIDIQ